MRSSISVDDGDDGDICCTGLEIPQDKMYRAIENGGFIAQTDSSGQEKIVYLNEAFVFRKHKNNAGVATMAVTAEEEPDENLQNLAKEVAATITDTTKKPVTDEAMTNLEKSRTWLLDTCKSNGIIVDDEDEE